MEGVQGNVPYHFCYQVYFIVPQDAMRPFLYDHLNMKVPNSSNKEPVNINKTNHPSITKDKGLTTEPVFGDWLIDKETKRNNVTIIKNDMNRWSSIEVIVMQTLDYLIKSV